MSTEEHHIYVRMLDQYVGEAVRYQALLEVKCTCGFEVVQVNKKREDAQPIILAHRLDMIEKKLGITVKILHVP